MITREQIKEIQAESREKGISIKQVLQEKGIPAHQYFGWKRKYSRSDIPEGSGIRTWKERLRRPTPWPLGGHSRHATDNTK